MILDTPADRFKWVNLPGILSKFPLIIRAHLLASTLHIDRISELSLADLDKTLLFENLSLFSAGFFELIIVSFTRLHSE